MNIPRYLLLMTLIFISSALNLRSQSIPMNSNTNRIEYEKVMQYTNKSKSYLYNKVKEWALINDVPILLSDSIEQDKIICEKLFKLKYYNKSVLSTVGSKEYGIQYNLIFDFKDGKIRCKITNLNFLEYKDPTATGIYWGYGITTSKLKSGEILQYEAEKFYPISKNEKKYQGMYNFFFTNIDNEILETYNKLNNYISSSNDNW